MKNAGCVVLFAMALALAAMPAAAATKVFLLGGQSNMAGVGKAAELVGPLAKYAAPQADVKLWDGTTNDWLALQAGFGGSPGYFGPEVSFGYAMHDAFPADEIYLIKYAVSGSMLADNMANPAHTSGTWKPGNSTTNPLRCYPAFKSTVDAAMASLAGKTPEIAGMLWMQGESDAYLNADAGAYKANLKSFINAVRNDFDAPNMPFVIGQITTAYGDAANNGLVRAAQAAVPAEVANTAWFPTEDLQGWQSGGHYNAQGQIDLGLRFAAVFVPEPPACGLALAGLFGLIGYGWWNRTQRHASGKAENAERKDSFTQELMLT